jgi:hypothetical protein
LSDKPFLDFISNSIRFSQVLTRCNLGKVVLLHPFSSAPTSSIFFIKEIWFPITYHLV